MANQVLRCFVFSSTRIKKSVFQSNQASYKLKNAYVCGKRKANGMIFTIKQNENQKVLLSTGSKIKLNCPYVQPDQACMCNFTYSTFTLYTFYVMYKGYEILLLLLRSLETHGQERKKDNYNVTGTKIGCAIQPWSKTGFLFQLQSREKDKDQGKVQTGSNA